MDGISSLSTYALSIGTSGQATGRRSKAAPTTRAVLTAIQLAAFV